MYFFFALTDPSGGVCARTAGTEHTICQHHTILPIPVGLTVGVQRLLAQLGGDHGHGDLLQDVRTRHIARLGVAPAVRLHELPVECLFVRTLEFV